VGPAQVKLVDRTKWSRGAACKRPRQLAGSALGAFTPVISVTWHILFEFYM
jgi:hypothetical protein